MQLAGQPESMQVVSVIAQKGGTGKTTMCLDTACAAAADGHIPPWSSILILRPRR